MPLAKQVNKETWVPSVLVEDLELLESLAQLDFQEKTEYLGIKDLLDHQAHQEDLDYKA